MFNQYKKAVQSSSINTASEFIPQWYVGRIYATTNRKPNANLEVVLLTTRKPIGHTQLDPDTKEFLAGVANDISLIYRDFCSEMGEHSNEKIPSEVGKVAINGSAITICRFDAAEAPEHIKQKMQSPGVAGDWIFIAGWPNSCDESDSGCTCFYFHEYPTREDIEKARLIKKVKIAIENRQLMQRYRCNKCLERVHWTDLNNDADLSFFKRTIMLKEKLCNCQSSQAHIQHKYPNLKSPGEADGSKFQSDDFFFRITSLSD